MWTLLLPVILLSFIPCKADQETIDYLAANINIQYNVIDNLIPAPAVTYEGELIMENIGLQTVTDLNWSLYFGSGRMFEPETIRPDGADLGTTGLRVYHINGNHHKIEPTPEFQGFGALQTLVVPFNGGDWQATATETLPNWYFVDDVSEPRVVASTAGEDMSWIGEFSTSNQWKRDPGDRYDPYTGPDRLANWADYDDLGGAQALILPTPLDESLDTGNTVTIGLGWVVFIQDPIVRPEGQLLADVLGLPVVEPPSNPTTSYISVTIGTVLDGLGLPVTESEAHRFDVNPLGDMIELVGNDRPGVFYGVQSLLSLYSASPDIPVGYVVDYPRFHYRGMHVDVSRNFFGQEDIYRLLDVMATYKMNKLHFHLTDDEGWRLEIPGIPELTDVGAQRCHDLTGDICILPQRGSAPEVPNDGSGYYTVNQYREILVYASEKHIEVIPEFDMPGHADAAVKAMMARYRKYIDTDIIAATQYLLTDLEDQSDYISGQMFVNNSVNPCIESTYTFITKVITEVITMHQFIQPLTTFNFGGDEVPSGAWEQSPACASIAPDNEAIKEYFVTNVAQIAASEGLDLSGWEDGFLKGGVPYDIISLPNNNVYAYAWNNVWEWGAAQRGYQLANADYKIILAPATHLYFDHPQEPDPYDRGLYWATRICPSIKTFGFIPDQFYENIDVSVMGDILIKDEICQSYGCEPLQLGKETNVLGLQGELWSEKTRPVHFDYMIFPRLLSLAERAWHKSVWEDMTDPADRETWKMLDWERFANTIGYKELDRLDQMGVDYYMNPPGAEIALLNILVARSEFPGQPIQYSMNDGVTWTDYTEGQIMQPGTILVITRSNDMLRSSREVELTVT